MKSPLVKPRLVIISSNRWSACTQGPSTTTNGTRKTPLTVTSIEFKWGLYIHTTELQGAESLFTCITTRATHLEVVTDVSTSQIYELHVSTTDSYFWQRFHSGSSRGTVTIACIWRIEGSPRSSVYSYPLMIQTHLLGTRDARKSLCTCYRH